VSQVPAVSRRTRFRSLFKASNRVLDVGAIAAPHPAAGRVRNLGRSTALNRRKREAPCPPPDGPAQPKPRRSSRGALLFGREPCFVAATAPGNARPSCARGGERPYLHQFFAVPGVRSAALNSSGLAAFHSLRRRCPAFSHVHLVVAGASVRAHNRHGVRPCKISLTDGRKLTLFLLALAGAFSVAAIVVIASAIVLIASKPKSVE
jgi:hypothetical protein